MKLHWVKHVRITDEVFSEKFGIHGDSVDAKGMKSQRVVHLTHPEVVADTLAAMPDKIEEQKAIKARALAKEKKKKENQFNLTGAAHHKVQKYPDGRFIIRQGILGYPDGCFGYLP